MGETPEEQEGRRKGGGVLMGSNRRKCVDSLAKNEDATQMMVNS